MLAFLLFSFFVNASVKIFALNKKDFKLTILYSISLFKIFDNKLLNLGKKKVFSNLNLLRL
jgi:hypothetical protein